MMHTQNAIEAGLAQKSDSFLNGQNVAIEGPRSENQKSGEASEGLPAENVHERTSEHFNAPEDNLIAPNLNPRNKSTFSKQLGSQESSLESSQRHQMMRDVHKVRHGRPAGQTFIPLDVSAATGAFGQNSSALKMRRNKKNCTAAQV